ARRAVPGTSIWRGRRSPSCDQLLVSRVEADHAVQEPRGSPAYRDTAWRSLRSSVRSLRGQASRFGMRARTALAPAGAGARVDRVGLDDADQEVEQQLALARRPRGQDSLV